MIRTARTLLVVLAATLILATAAPLAAAEPARGGFSTDLTSEPSAGVEPTGTTTACDLKLSVVDGPLVDANFSVRAYEPFIVWGFGYPAESTVFLEFSRFDGSFSFDAIADSGGEFVEDFQYTPGSDTIYPEAWSLTADSVGGECIDGITVNVQPPYPFTDIDGFENEIAWLWREGITGGCTATAFCPDNSVTRGQMAAFLSRALGLPATGTDFFDDDDGTSFEGDINRLAAAGITGGCATRRFCPDANVTREQMASFLARAFTLPGATSDYFGDDDASIHEADINRLAKSGITGGCATNRYCPQANVTREQMAAFLYRALTR